MIPILDSLTDPERCQRDREVLECYVSAIRNLAHYSVELDEPTSAAYRQYLSNLADEVAAGGLKALDDSRATLRGLLRDYRDKAAKYLAGLRQELAGTAQALQETLNSLAQADGDQETRLRTTLHQIRHLPDSADQGMVRSVILNAADSIEQSLDQIHRQHRLTVSQFVMEIGMLHKRIDQLESAAALDGLAKLFSRADIENRIRSASPAEYSLLLIRTNGLQRAGQQFNCSVAAELVVAFTRRLRNSLPPDTPIGKWADEQFVALVAAPHATVAATTRWISEHLSGEYSCIKDGKTVRPSLDLSVTVVDCAGDSPEGILQRTAGFFSPETDD